MGKKLNIIVIYVLIYISLLLVYPVILHFLNKEPPVQVLINSFAIIPFSFLFNLFIALFLLLAGISFLSFLELRKAKNAYNKARNRVGFIKDGQVVCFEGEIQPEEGYPPLISPITQTPSVLYCYGNKYIGGGTTQIKSVIKPSGEIIPLYGWLSGEYVRNEEYDPQNHNLDHLFSFMMERRKGNINSQDVARAPYFYKTKPGVIEKNNFENHEIIGTLNSEDFQKHKYTEIIIPTGMYGWVLGKWDDKNKRLLPLKFAGYIFVIENNYRKTFLRYIARYRRNYLVATLSLILLSVFLSIPIFLPIISKYF